MSVHFIVRRALGRVLRLVKARYHLTKRRLRHFRQRVLFRTAIFLYGCRHRVIAIWRGILARTDTYLATLGGVIIAAVFATTLPHSLLNGLKVSEVHLACAGIIGTALALVLTLSIVPAQKAADVFSTAILKLYARDRHLLGVYGLLSFFVLISVLFGTSWTFGVSGRDTIALQLIVLGGSLDAVRAFYVRSLNLLVPSTALSLVAKECDRFINAMRRDV